MFSYRRGTRDFLGERKPHRLHAFCPEVVGQGFNTTHVYSESPMFKHKLSPKDQWERTHEYLRNEAERKAAHLRKYPRSRILPALNP